MKNLMIGMGGTGAKVVESFIHLCGAGLGPKEDTAIGFVDQDKANGNTSRALSALGRYLDARRHLVDQNSKFRVREGIPLLATKLIPHRDPNKSQLENCHWTPHPDTGEKLADMIKMKSMSSSLQDFARVLFADDDEELEMILDKGYRGRPHVGATALIYETEDGDWWRQAKHFVERGANHNTVRIFLAGSVFGGTGAAVFPTVARRLRQMAQEEEAKKVRISGALMLPYFNFGSGDADKNYVTPPQIVQQTKAALDFYAGMFKEKESELVFDNLYVVGWNPMFQLDYHEPGSEKQCNPPLVPELLAALAAAEDFRVDPDPSKPPKGRVLVISREKVEQLGWDDLPDPAGASLSPYEGWGAWLRFLSLWRFIYRDALDISKGKAISQEAWYRALIGRTLKSDMEAGGALNDIDRYCETALKYAAAMAAYSNVSSDHKGLFGLWESRPLAEVDTENPQADVCLKGTFQDRESELESDFEELVHSGGKPAPRNLNAVFECLSGAKPHDGKPGLGAFVTALYESATMKSVDEDVS